ncbi:PREDICTED: uncharacterized protein LOC109583188 [Amphimedon queenslandica]|uniref:B box-type domain-containing protein n=1 Tax=Amphimedon queenslandica TaxID=400682 RepID=A0A1X7UHP0_AMPQE|nr:PREDICTED: uncharacterized protein LOC109583188 [Amphimedon queenslandica]|eukprot:XP_019853986.1 PREDICTED: uncharacterized protein LOC109583188 [Amphimedon queenslandica]
MTSKRVIRDNSSSRAKDICRQHNEQLTVYCNTCDICICASCALWGKHRQEDHDIKPLDELHKKHKDVFTTELKKLKTRMSEIISLVEQVDLKIEKVKTEKGKTKQEIETTLGAIDVRLDEQMKLKLQKLIEAKRRLKQEVHDISSLSAELETRLKGSKSEFIQQEKVLRERMMAKIQKLQESQCNDLERVLEIGNFVNEVVPQGEESTFEIKNFKEKQRSGAEIFSPLLSFSGLAWRLKVYPNGHGAFTGRYLCTFIELYGGYSQPATYHYSVELVRMSGRGGNKNFKREYSSDFVVGDLWGYKKFYDLSKLESEGYLVHDTLVLKFSINHPTYFDKCRDLMLHVNDLKHKIMSLKHQNNQLRQKCQGIKDVDDDDPPPKPQASTSSSLSNSSPAHSSIKSGTGGGTQTSPAHSSSVGMGGVTQTSPAHSSHDRSSSGSMAGPHFSQPIHHFKESSRQSYHPMTPHATLITPLASSSGSTSTQWTNPPPPPNHYNSFTQQQFMYPPTQEGRGFNPHATPHHNSSRRQSLDPKMLRLIEQQKWNTFAQSQMDYPTNSFLGHHGFKETPIPEAGGYMRPMGGSKTQLHSGSMPRLNFQDLSQGSREGEEEGETGRLGIGDYNADLDPHSMPGVLGGGGGGSQMGSMMHPGLASQEYFDHAPHMPFLPDMYQMSQPDLLLYHQRCAYPPSSSRGVVKQQATPNQMSKMEKHMSLTDVSSLVDSSPAHSRSIATLHEGAESSWGAGLRPMKPYQRSQTTLPVTDLPPNQHGPPGLASTLAARLASPINQSPSPSRPTSARRISQHSRQPRHPRPLSGVGPVQVVQPEGGRERRGQQQRKEMEHQLRGREEEGRREMDRERKTDGVSSSPPLASVSLSQSSPESVTSQLTQSDSSHQHQPTSKLRSSRRYTQKIKTNNGASTSDTPTLSLTLTDQPPSTKETGGQQRQEQESTSTGGFSRISVGQRTSSNTSLAAEII